jgi:transposase
LTRVKKLYKDGGSLREIAKMTGVAANTVRKLLAMEDDRAA